MRAYLFGSNGPAGLPRLQYADEDVNSLAKLLSSDKCCFHVRTPPSGQTVHQIHSDILSSAAECDVDDSLLVYFAGHGALEGGKLYLLWDTTDIDYIPFTSFHVRWLQDALDLCQARHKLLILDCCHAGAAKGVRTFDQVRVDELIASNTNQILFASDRFERAREFDEYKGSFLANGIKSVIEVNEQVTSSSLVSMLRTKAFEHNRLPQPSVPVPFLFGQQSGDFVIAETESKDDTSGSAASLADNVRSPVPGPQTVTIGSGHDCHFLSLTEALQASPPESVMALSSGVYDEDVHIDRPVELRPADGNAGVEIRGTLRVSADCSVHGITFRGVSKDVVTVDRGSVSFRDCTIHAADTHSCLKALTECSVKLKNTILSGGAHGIIVAFHAKTSVDGCEIREHANVGVLVDRGQLLMTECIVEDCSIGIDVRNHAFGVIKRCRIEACPLIGIEVTTNSDVEITRNVICNNGQGLRFEHNSSGTVANNEVFSNSMSGLHVVSGASPVVQDNDIRSNDSDGVIVFSGGMGTYEKNRVSDNGAHGFDVQTMSSIVMRRNRVFRNAEDGLRVAEKCEVKSESDEFYLNECHGVDVVAEAVVGLALCVIHNCRHCGILASSSVLRVSDSEISSNGLSGAEIRGGELLARGCTITRNQTNGIWVKQSARAEISDTTFLKNGLFGALVEAYCSMSSCMIAESGQDGISFQGSGEGVVVGCQIRENDWGGIFIGNGTTPSIEGNVVENNRDGGVRIEGRGGGKISTNIIRGNKPGQILVSMPLEDLVTQIDRTTQDPGAISWVNADEDNLKD